MDDQVKNGQSGYEVTVLILVYNGNPAKIRKTLASVMSQENVRLQLVVADDGSKDNLRQTWEEMLREYRFTDYRLVMNETNRGTVSNICSGLDAAEGTYTKLISPGDSLNGPLVLRDWVDFMEKEKAEWSFSDAVYYQTVNGEDVTVSVPAHPQDLRPYLQRDLNRRRWNYIAFHDLPLGAAILSTTALIRETCGRIRDKGIVYGEDNLWRVLMFEGNVCAYYPREAIRYECDTGISGNSTWKQRLLADWARADEMIRETPDPDPFQQKLLKAVWPEGNLREAALVRGIWPHMLRKKFRPRMSVR